MKQKKEITLASLADCTACAACVSICPQECITMAEDKEGFLQPKIDTKQCILCHKCEKTCPILNTESIPDDFETKAYAAINKDDVIRAQSSSGGVFFPLAKWVIEQGGVVFGARWNEKWEVVHDYAEDIEGIKAFMRSKYVQSVVGDTLKQTKEFLESGRWVLYSGTPCQLGGLRAYLGKEYEKLIQVDLVCHGVPSPGVWRSYLKDYHEGETILDINFRDKRDGWLGFQCVTTTTTVTTHCEKQMENPYFRGFLTNVYLRNSCYNCRFRHYHRASDLTLADYWGVNDICPEMHDNKGTSIVFAHSAKGSELLSVLTANFRVIEQELSNSTAHNLAMYCNMPIPFKRKNFFRYYQKSFSFQRLIKYIDKDKFLVRLIRKLRKIGQR